MAIVPNVCTAPDSGNCLWSGDGTTEKSEAVAAMLEADLRQLVLQINLAIAAIEQSNFL